MSKKTSNKISIVGTNGVGKTVFVTVWAKSLEKKERGQPFIVPTPLTFAYIERNWLQRLKKGLWPESTPQSEFIELKWTLKSPNGTESEISVCDLAGHDVRRLYAGDEPKISDETAKTIYDSIESANIILLIVNLKDFITVEDTLRIQNTTNLLSMLKHFFSKKKKVALLFSQWHEYEAWLSEKGGLEKVLETYLPSVQNACSLYGADVRYFKVSAVVETIHNVNSDGRSVIMPDPCFSSTGLDEINKWIIDSPDDQDDLDKFPGLGFFFGSMVGLALTFLFKAKVTELVFICGSSIGMIIGGSIQGMIFLGQDAYTTVQRNAAYIFIQTVLYALFYYFYNDLWAIVSVFIFLFPNVWPYLLIFLKKLTR